MTFLNQFLSEIIFFYMLLAFTFLPVLYHISYFFLLEYPELRYSLKLQYTTILHMVS